MVGIPHDAPDRMPVRSQKALEPQRDLATATSDDHAHAGEAIANLLIRVRKPSFGDNLGGEG
jgi:hypothetical protein